MSDANPEIEINPDLCVGSGDCARIAPLAFEVDDAEGIAVVLPTASQEDRATLDAAAYECPTGAITVSSKQAG